MCGQPIDFGRLGQTAVAPVPGDGKFEYGDILGCCAGPTFQQVPFDQAAIVKFPMWSDKMASYGLAVIDQYGNGFAQGPDRRAALSLCLAGIDLRAFAMQPGNRGPAGQIKTGSVWYGQHGHGKKDRHIYLS